jgi:hypothetical protein
MDKTRQEVVIENVVEDNQEQDKDLRTLKDLELFLVGGGGDDFGNW